MKKRFLAGLATGLFLLAMGGVANATLYVNDGGFVDVGTTDTYITSATQEGNQSLSLTNVPNGGVELDWINLYLGTNYTSTEFDQISPATWLTVYSSTSPLIAQVPETYALKLTNQPDYFFVKTGNNQTTPDYRYFLFANDANYDYAVFELQTDGYTIQNFGALSHGGQAGGAPVPEPATMLLFGAGLAGLAGFARRKVQ